MFNLQVLADALSIMERKGLDEHKVRLRFINPKAVTMGQLYGQFDPVSYEWTDGVVATTFRYKCDGIHLLNQQISALLPSFVF